MCVYIYAKFNFPLLLVVWRSITNFFSKLYCILQPSGTHLIVLAVLGEVG